MVEKVHSNSWHRSRLQTKNGRPAQDWSCLLLCDPRSVYKAHGCCPCRTCSQIQARYTTVFGRIWVLPSNHNWHHDDRWPALNLECHCWRWSNKCVFFCGCTFWLNQVPISNFYWQNVPMLRHWLPILYKVCMGSSGCNDGCITERKV